MFGTHELEKTVLIPFRFLRSKLPKCTAGDTPSDPRRTGENPKLLLAKWKLIRRFGGSYLENMMIHTLALLAFAPPPQSGENGTAYMLKMFGFMGVMLFVMYFLMIRPQRTRQKQLEALLKNVKPGDKVVTGSGILGTVITVKEKSVSIRSADSKLEVLKSTISEITEKATDKGVEAAAQS
jgi:preprotein translocase subunit YajC